VSSARLILASASPVRARLLREAGLAFTVAVSGVDEKTIKESAAHSDIETLALRLAQAKAAAVSTLHPDAHVIGADQILECDGTLYDKPADLVAARSHLGRLRGRTHRLVTACTVFRGEKPLWEHIEAPKLTMRAFSDAFLDDYLALTGEKVTTSVGAYQLEHVGAQLFERIEGDYFAILGLPLLPLLSFLRQEGLVPA
jgi:septum formation protein